MKTFAEHMTAGAMRRWLALGLCALAAGCGGGGGGGGSALPAVLPATTTTTTTTAAATTTPAASSTPVASTTQSNVAAILVDAGPAAASGQINVPYVSVTVCAPGSTSNCQTVDHVIVDTGSEGLRLVASALTRLAALTPQTDTSGTPYAECAQFASGYTWGSVKLASVSIGGLTAPSVPVQIVGDPAFPTVPAACASVGAAQNSVAALGGNGLLGVGAFAQDCGAACAARAIAGTYYACPSGSSCTASTIAVARQVVNPVALFPTDNNGVLIQLPAIAATGATNVAGALVFGIGTRSNNALGTAKAYGLNATGSFSTTLNGVTYSDSFVDSGSNFFYFNTTSLAKCTDAGFTGFYCPSATTPLTLVNTGANGTTGTVDISIGNVSTLVRANTSGTAFNDIAGTLSTNSSFDFGLPFFYGRNVFNAIEGASTPGGTGPYVAF